ncbi:MAG: GntR family transcriptional regulator [Alphaproteobacteria bacterium]|nr:GntR family transcriptional regulator [Alphaproteobacteria bacterium]
MLRENAYAAFKESLFAEQLHPGQFLSIQELCDGLNVSISPLRDALRQLESEGLVELLPKKGVRIAKVDRDFITNAFQVRRFLEVQACYELKDNGWPELQEIRNWTKSVAVRAETNIDEILLQDAYKADWAFHDGLIAAIGNDLLTQIHGRNSDKVRMVRLNRRFIASRVLPAMQEHLKILDALIVDDRAAAAAALNEHLCISEARALGKEPGLA